MSFTIHATRDPAMIRRAVEINHGDAFSYGIDNREFVRRRIDEESAGASWAAFPAVTGYPAMVIKARAHHVIATGEWGFLEQQYKQLEAQLAASKGVRGARKSAAIHLAAPDGRWFTVEVPSGEVGFAHAGAKKARPVYGQGIRFAWDAGRLVLTANTGSSLKQSYGRSFIAKAQEGYGSLQGRPSRVGWDWIEALCGAACSMTPASVAEFGRATGICAVCGRPLTDKLSKERGIGPVCWDRVTGPLEVALAGEVG